MQPARHAPQAHFMTSRDGKVLRASDREESADVRRSAEGPAESSPSTKLADHALVTPDGRYIVVRDRLWRRTDPSLAPARRLELVKELMGARRAVAAARRAEDPEAEQMARAAVQAAKVALGERGPVWWTDGDPDLTRRMARTTSYAEWYAIVSAD